MAESISNVQNKYVFAEEDTYGSVPTSPTFLDVGYVQSISLSEDDGVEEVNAINTGHTLADIDEDVYNLSGSITTKLSQAGLKQVLKALFGVIQEDTPSIGQFTAQTSPVHSDTLSYFMKFNNTSGNVKIVTGIGFTGGEINVTRDGSIEVTMNFQAQKMTSASESLSPVTNVGSLYRGLDAYVTYDGNDTILQEFTISLDWNYSEEDSRAIENTTDRRTIQRIIRNNLSVSGNFESRLDNNIDNDYQDQKSKVDIVLNLSRGSYSSTWTISSSKVTTKERELNTEDSVKTISCDYTGTDIEVVGDTYSSS